MPSTPAVLFVPAIEEDCLGVKLAQDALSEKLPRVIVLYAPSLLIVATSNSQASSAVELSRALGFDPQVAHTQRDKPSITIDELL